MKEFVKTMLAVIAALIVRGIIRVFFWIMMIAGMAASGATATTTVIPRHGGVLDLDMSAFTVGEQTSMESMPTFSSRSFSTVPTVGLRDAVKALQSAAADPSVSFVLLRADGASAGISHLEELRKAIIEFRLSGKPVVAYTENPGNGSYYLYTAADKIYMGAQHGGNPTLIGLASQQIFLKDILSKLGVNVQLIRHGKYKSAGEMFIRSSSSPENREQNQVMVNSLWSSLSEQMALSRDITVEDFNALVDNLSLVLPEDFLYNGLVDELLDHEALVQKVCTLAGTEDPKKLAFIAFPDYVNARVLPARGGKNEIAVIYADGEIVEGKQLQDIAADRFVAEIDKVRKDKNVKAVVLRVNSPGGSVSASVKIRAALDLLQKEKPLVASFGDYAASGGYWISNGCQKIYSDETTITGSIGVFSMIPEFSKVTKNAGVGIETIGSNKHSDMFSLMRAFDDEELKYMQASVEDIYEMFVNLVAESRGMDTESVDAIAQGRVWAGSDAIKIGLVDQIGTLEDAVCYAAALANLYSADEYHVKGYPAVPTFLEKLMEGLGTSSSPSILKGTAFEGVEKALDAIKAGKPSAVYARLPYSLNIR